MIYSLTQYTCTTLLPEVYFLIRQPVVSFLVFFPPFLLVPASSQRVCVHWILLIDAMPLCFSFFLYISFFVYSFLSYFVVKRSVLDLGALPGHSCCKWSWLYDLHHVSTKAWALHHSHGLSDGNSMHRQGWMSNTAPGRPYHADCNNKYDLDGTHGNP